MSSMIGITANTTHDMMISLNIVVILNIILCKLSTYLKRVCFVSLAALNMDDKKIHERNV